MSGQCRHVQAGFNCTLPVPETGYSCMGRGALHAFWLRTEPLAAMVKLVQYPNLGMVSAPQTHLLSAWFSGDLHLAKANQIANNTYCLLFRWINQWHEVSVSGYLPQIFSFGLLRRFLWSQVLQVLASDRRLVVGSTHFQENFII